MMPAAASATANANVSCQGGVTAWAGLRLIIALDTMLRAERISEADAPACGALGKGFAC